MAQTSGTLRRCLEDLERRIDPAVEEALWADWARFVEGRWPEPWFAPRRQRSAPPGTEWPVVGVNAALDDFEAMALQQFRICSEQLAGASGALMCVRCNYGTIIVPSLFGVRLHRMADQLDTLPACWPLDRARLDEVLAEGPPPPRTGYAARVFETGERLRDIIASYPRIRQYVHLYHPDFQGPTDICEMLWGSGIFTAFLEEPESVDRLLALVTQTYLGCMREWERIVPPRDSHGVHWGFLHPGRIVLRDDSAMNLSPELFDRFVRPHDERLLEELGGGVVHFCGRGQHFIAGLCAMAGLHAVNLSQPELNDMEHIYRHSIDQGLLVLALPKWAAEQALEAGRPLHGRVHVV
jgi:hypothetical protein